MSTDGLANGEGLRNPEGHHDFDITWPWVHGPLKTGSTAVLRVQNEAQCLPFVLPPLLRAVDEVLVVDNRSSDGTLDVARETAERIGMPERLRTAEYPFQVSRAGKEHLGTHELSVHSLAYFYNWCFAQVHTAYSWKWDGDMVLTLEGQMSLADMSWQVGRIPGVVRIPRHGLYVADERKAYLDVGLKNSEEWGYPVSPEFTYTKAPEWEIRTTPTEFRKVQLPQGMVVELKFLDSDEFDHWTDPTSFATSERNRRKRREWEVFHALNEGRVLDGVLEVESPTDEHVIDYVSRYWLPSQPRPLVMPLVTSDTRGPGRADESRSTQPA